MKVGVGDLVEFGTGNGVREIGTVLSVHLYRDPPLHPQDEVHFSFRVMTPKGDVFWYDVYGGNDNYRVVNEYCPVQSP